MKYAIQINRNYDGATLKPRYLIASFSDTERKINELKTNPIELQEEIRKEEKFLRYPDITVIEHEARPHPKDSKCTILATVTAQYTVNVPKKGVSLFPVVLVTVCILFITFAIFVLQLAKQSHEKSQIQDACYMYTKNGVPTSITINGNDYKLNPNGTMEGLDRIFLNPYDEIDLAKAECIRINTK